MIFKRSAEFFKKYWYFILICFILFLAIAFRAEIYFLNRQFWPDEAALAANIVCSKGFLWAFLPLEYFQMAPPLFLISTKIMACIFGLSEQVFRLVPFLVSLISIPVFYILSKKFLNSKRAIIFANFLYCINFALIRYASEFKQYSSDILIFMLVLLWCEKIDTDNLNLRHVLFISVIFSLLFFISQPTVFLLFGLIVYGLLKNIKNYKLCLTGLLPLILVILYKMQMLPDVSSYMQYYWADGFISLGNFWHFLAENLNFFFYEIKCLYFLCPLIFIGFFIVLYRVFVLCGAGSQKGLKIGKILVLSMFGLFLAGVLHLYPILNRMILFLFPFIFIFIASVFDFRLKNARLDKLCTAFMAAFIILFLILFGLKIICKNRDDIIIDCCRGRDLTIILKENFKEDDILLVSKFNESFYKYYDALFNINDAVILNVPEDKNLINFLKKADKNKNYWVYIPCNSSLHPLPRAIKTLENKGEIKVFYKLHLAQNSYLYKIKLII